MCPFDLSVLTSLHFHCVASCCLLASNKMKFDNILSEINGFGRFQITLFLMQMFSRMTLPCHFLLNNFMAAVPSHHCDLSALQDGGIFGNLTLHQKLSAGIPTERDGTRSSCQMFTEPQYQYLTGSNNSEEASSVSCQTGWVYDNRTFKSTLVTEVTHFNCCTFLHSIYILLANLFSLQIRYFRGGNMNFQHLIVFLHYVLPVGSCVQQQRAEQGNSHYFLYWRNDWSSTLWVP